MLLRKRVSKIALIVLLCFLSNSNVALATNLQDKIDSNNQQINELEKEKENIKEQSKEMNKELQSILLKVNDKNKELNESKKKVEEFQVQIDGLQKEIDNVQNRINEMENELSIKKNTIQAKEEETKTRQAVLDERLRNYYKNDMVSQILNLLISSENFGTLISNIVNVSRIIRLDNDLLEDIQKLQEQLNREIELLNEEVKVLDEGKLEVQKKQDDLKNAQKLYITEKNKHENQMSQLKSIEKEKEKVINTLSDKDKEIQDRIGNLNDFNKDLQNQMDKIMNDINNGSDLDGSVSSGEGFLRPTTGRISSPYGPRKHPVTGANGFHTGIDIAASKGTPIVASKSGVVAFSGVQNGYGNVVIIDHGAGVQTLYAHCDTLNVKKGQTVSRGAKIATVGSTGMSTGPHLHFEVREGGVHKNPMNYL